MIVENAVGNRNGALVDANNHVAVFAISESEAQDAVFKGNAYNINTGIIGLTSSTESACLYIQNNESPSNGESTLFIESFIIGIDDQGTTAGMSQITVVKNPTGGTIGTGATDVDIAVNRDFGTSTSLDADTKIYKGAEGNTLTGGTDYAVIYQQTGTRGNYPINTALRKGNSLGIKIDTQTSSGTTNLYIVLQCYRVDGKNGNA